jgi:hypothetical protein
MMMKTNDFMILYIDQVFIWYDYKCNSNFFLIELYNFLNKLFTIIGYTCKL